MSCESPNNLEQIVDHFKLHFHVAPTLKVRCPGRVNLIGEHIDYMGYGVFPMAIEQETVLLLAPTDEPVIRLHNVDSAHFPDFTFELPSDWQGTVPPKWQHYFLSGWKGAMEYLKTEQKGMLIQVSGNVPHSSGLSSSSSLVCAAALATIVHHSGHGFENISREQFAELCAKAEQYVGTAGGGMDQAAEVLSQEGKALRIDFNPLRSFTVNLPPTSTFVVMHSGDILNKAATSQFNQRVVECRISATLLLKSHNLTSPTLRLKDVQDAFGKTLEEMVQLAEKLPITATKKEILDIIGLEALDKCLTPNTQHLESFIIRQRARHVFSEALRVKLMESACEKGDLVEMGKLMYQSHESCSKDYDCSCPALDQLVEGCRQVGVLGARLTGAGWGGCAVALIDNSNPPDLSGLKVFFESKPSAGISHEYL